MNVRLKEIAHLTFKIVHFINNLLANNFLICTIVIDNSLMKSLKS